jgi:hypothetical protein
MNEPFTAEMAKSVAKAERDRIIQLITAEREKAAMAMDHQTRLLATSFIALIKGENK